MQHVQPAREGAHGRHHQPRAIGRKTAPAHRTPAPGDLGDRVKVARHLARLAGRLMPEDQRAEAQHLGSAPAEMGRGIGIVVALDPDPVMRAGQRPDTLGIDRRQARFRAAVMETVAERNNCFGLQGRTEFLDPRQRGGGVIGRQHLAGGGVVRALFQMQVGDDEHALRVPPERALRQRREHLPGKMEQGLCGLGRGGGHRPQN